jgi:hypothetical protein
VFVEPCNWQVTRLGSIQGRPTGGKALSRMSRPKASEELAGIARDILEIVQGKAEPDGRKPRRPEPDRGREGGALGNLGNAYRVLGETRRAIELFEQQLGIARETRDRWTEGLASWNLGVVAEEQGATLIGPWNCCRCW